MYHYWRNLFTQIPPLTRYSTRFLLTSTFFSFIPMPTPSKDREPIAGPDKPEPPFPLKLRGEVIKGFGRGSKELGIPTANIPISGLSINGHDELSSGIYYGWAGLDFTSAKSTPSAAADSHNFSVADLESRSTTPLPIPTPNPLERTVSKGPHIYPMVMSLGYNPFYKNTVRSVEVHIMHAFPSDFYGATLSLVILGFIRPEYDYVSKDALVDDIRTDIQVARRSLEREAYQSFKDDGWVIGQGGEENGQIEHEVKS